MILPRLSGFVALLLLGALTPATAAPPGGGWALAWNDEFEGAALDGGKWIHWLTGPRRDAVNTPAAVTVAGGNLTISTYTSGGTHYTGMVATEGRFQPAYGYLEARIDYDGAPGMWSAYWLQSPTTGNPIGDPGGAGTEIDISEHRSHDSSGADISNLYYSNVHWDGYGADHKSSQHQQTISGLGTGFHIYGLEWTPTVQRFYVDGVLRRAFTTAVSQRSEFIVLSSEVQNGDWSGSIPGGGYGTQGSTTTKMIVDYVRVYQRAEYVQNADLETRVAPWTQINQASLAPGSGRNGSQGVRLNPNTVNGSSLRQTVYGLLQNTDYVATGWAAAVQSYWPIRIGVDGYGGPQVYQSIGSGTFAQASVPFTTGRANTSATIFGWQPTQWADGYIDDFQLRRAAAANNPHLEAGDFGPWYSYGSTSVAADGTAHSGGYALRFASAVSGAEQEILGLQPNTAYRLSGWTIHGGQIGVKNHGGGQVTSAVSGASWTRGLVDFTTGATNTTATIFAWRPGGTATAYADDFFIHQPLAAPWSAQDVTDIPLDGLAGRRGTKFLVQASGADIWNASDRFHFVHQQFTGDCEITARVCSIEDTGYFAKAGVMMRESLSSSVRQVTVDWTPGKAVELIRRTTAGANAVSDVFPNFPDPQWVRITRRGNVFTGYFSPDGVTWTQAGAAQTIAMPQTIYAGLATCAFNDATYTQATFDDVTAANLPPAVVFTRPAADFLTIVGAPMNLRLTAGATDDGLHGAITTAWSMLSGPASVTFANAGSADTSVRFPQVGTYVLRFTATNSVGPATRDLTVVVSPASDALALRLKLDETSGTTAIDTSGHGRNATLVNSPAWVAGQAGNAVSLNGTNQYLTLPTGLLSAVNDFTISAWVKVNALSTWARIFDFGTGGSTYLFLTPQNGGNGFVRYAITTSGWGGEQVIDGTAPLPTGAWTHVAVTLSGSAGTLYVNGVAVGSNAAMTLKPSSLGTTTLNYLGRSQFADPYLNGLVDNFQIHQRALSAGEIGAMIAQNLAPVLACGAAPAAINGVTTALSGSATSDLALTTAWTKVGGPGTVSFGNASSAATSVTFNQTGAYSLRLTSANARAEVFNELTVNVAANPNLYSDWASLNWPGVNDPNVIGAEADPDRDGTKNLIEWSLGLDAKTSDAKPWTAGQPGVPVCDWVKVGGLDYLALHVRRPIGRTGVTYSARVTGDFSGWSAGVQHGSPTANGDGTETVTFRDTIARGDATSRAIRLEVTQ